MNSTFTMRIDRNDKVQAQKILKKIGMDLSSGVNTFIKQLITDKALPFQPRTENGYTPEYEAILLKESEWAKKHAKRYNSVKEMMAALRK
jgi:DNA-damage-inducible protein J